MAAEATAHIRLFILLTSGTCVLQLVEMEIPSIAALKCKGRPLNTTRVAALPSRNHFTPAAAWTGSTFASSAPYCLEVWNASAPQKFCETMQRTLHSEHASAAPDANSQTAQENTRPQQVDVQLLRTCSLRRQVRPKLFLPCIALLLRPPQALVQEASVPPEQLCSAIKHCLGTGECSWVIGDIQNARN
jgi:hypothetical protein